MKDVENVDIEKIVKDLRKARDVIERWVPMFEQYNSPAVIDYAIDVIITQSKLIDDLYEAYSQY